MWKERIWWHNWRRRSRSTLRKWETSFGEKSTHKCVNLKEQFRSLLDPALKAAQAHQKLPIPVGLMAKHPYFALQKIQIFYTKSTGGYFADIFTQTYYYEKGIFNSHNNSNGSWKFLNKNYFNGFNVVKSCRCCLLLWTIRVQRREYFFVLDDINVTSHTLTSESSSAPKNCFKTLISLIRYQICLNKTTFCKRTEQHKERYIKQTLEECHESEFLPTHFS